MENLSINGISVNFPLKPYPLQIAYMNQVISSLKKRKNALLESPTGTGKTLSLLCSTLAWLEAEKLNIKNRSVTSNLPYFEPELDSIHEKIDSPINSCKKWTKIGPRILYTSRTHIQLSQAIKELKRTNYLNNDAVVLGSRDQLCIHPDVIKLVGTTAKNQACQLKRKRGMCHFYHNYEDKVRSIPEYTESNVLDIEDLISLGQKHQCCPFFASKILKEKTDVTFLPYNYIIDPSIRKAQSVNLRNSVIIFDEGHNIENVCENSMSTELSSTTLATCISESTKFLEMLKDDLESQNVDLDIQETIKDLTADDIISLKEILCQFERQVDEAVENSNEERTVHPGSWIFDALHRSKITMDNYKMINVLLQKLAYYLSLKAISSPLLASLAYSFINLETFFNTLFPDVSHPLLFLEYKSDFPKHFRIVTDKSSNNNPCNPNAWKLHIWCLTPSIAMKKILLDEVHNIIITSGTLAPLNSFEIEMGIPFQVRLQNPHIIESNRLSVNILTKGVNGVSLNSKYDNKDNLEYYKSMGKSIVNYCQIIPHGILIFFSSYTFMHKTISKWKENENIWQRIEKEKRIFVEGKFKDQFNADINLYKEINEDSKMSGAIFLGVCRGKLSEGLDLNDDHCRGVIVVGLPYPSIADFRVILKKKYLDDLKNKELTSTRWYCLQMKRALNQAIGRVIRHRMDFGVVILMDLRFSLQTDGLSKWIQSFIRKDDYETTIQRVKSFFYKFNEASHDYSRELVCPLIKSKFELHGTQKSYSLNVDLVKKSDPALVKQYETLPRMNGRLKNEKVKSGNIFDMFKNVNKKDLRDGGECCTSEYFQSSGSKFKCENPPEPDVKKRKIIVPFKSLDNSGSEHITNLDIKIVLKRYNDELKEVFKGTDNYIKLCTAFQKYKSNRAIKELTDDLMIIFQNVNKMKRDELILAFGVAIPTEKREEYVDGCKVDKSQYYGEFISKIPGYKKFLNVLSGN